MPFKRRIAVVILLLSLSIGDVYPSDWGEYRGEVRVEWLDDGRSMRLLDDYSYTDPQGITWVAPVDSVVDGASIPRIGWSSVGPPFVGLYRNASVIHDIACDEKKRSWEAVHLAFYRAMRASGVSIAKAKSMYAAVYLGGPRWPQKIARNDITVSEAEQIVDLVRLQSDPSSRIEQKILPNEAARADGRNTIDLVVRITPVGTDITDEKLNALIEEIQNKDMSLEDIRSKGSARQ